MLADLSVVYHLTTCYRLDYVPTETGALNCWCKEGPVNPWKSLYDTVKAFAGALKGYFSLSGSIAAEVKAQGALPKGKMTGFIK